MLHGKVLRLFDEGSIDDPEVGGGTHGILCQHRPRLVGDCATADVTAGLIHDTVLNTVYISKRSIVKTLVLYVGGRGLRLRKEAHFASTGMNITFAVIISLH